MKELEDALLHEAVMNVFYRRSNGRAKRRARVMLQAMTQARFDPRRRRSSPSRSAVSRLSNMPTVDEALERERRSSGESVHLAKKHERAHQSRYARHHRAEPAPTRSIAAEVRQVIVLTGVEPRHESAAPNPHIFQIT